MREGITYLASFFVLPIILWAALSKFVSLGDAFLMSSIAHLVVLTSEPQSTGPVLGSIVEVYRALVTILFGLLAPFIALAAYYFVFVA